LGQKEHAYIANLEKYETWEVNVSREGKCNIKIKHVLGNKLTKNDLNGLAYGKSKCRSSTWHLSDFTTGTL
jgi:hypothetical protein